jgi:hypothetical protein
VVSLLGCKDIIPEISFNNFNFKNAYIYTMKRIILAGALIFGGLTGFAQSALKFTATLANNNSQSITRESIMAEPVVSAAPVPSMVSSFEVKLTTADGRVFGPYATKGNKLNEETLAHISRLKKGDQITIDKIVVSSGKDHEAATVSYVIEK